MALEGIRTIDTKKDAEGDYQHVRLVFGPHYFVELHRESNGKVTFVLGATHHGFKAEASLVALALIRAADGRPDLVLQDTVINLLANVYPVMHHRRTRLRIVQLLYRRSERKTREKTAKR